MVNLSHNPLTLRNAKVDNIREPTYNTILQHGCYFFVPVPLGLMLSQIRKKHAWPGIASKTFKSCHILFGVTL